MKLLGSLTSPYVRKTRIVLAEKKIEYDFVLESLQGESTSIAAHNPLGKVPALILDDETCVFDSRVIVEYLDNLAPNNRLIPASGRERMLIKRWEALCDGICDAAVAVVLEGKRPTEHQSAEWLTRHRGKIQRALAVCENDLDEQAWCHGTSISLADIALGTALGYLSFRLPDIDWCGQHANLARHYDKLIQRASFADTVPQG